MQPPPWGPKAVSDYLQERAPGWSERKGRDREIWLEETVRHVKRMEGVKEVSKVPTVRFLYYTFLIDHFSARL